MNWGLLHRILVIATAQPFDGKKPMKNKQFKPDGPSLPHKDDSLAPAQFTSALTNLKDGITSQPSVQLSRDNTNAQNQSTIARL